MPILQELNSRSSSPLDTDRVGPKVQDWILAALVLTVSTALFNVKVVAHLNERRAVAPEVAERYGKLLARNDTSHYLEHLERAVEALKHGRVYFPVSNFDCPVTYLLTAGALVLLTGWPLLVAHNVFFLLVFWLNGLAAFAFLRCLLRSVTLALTGALVYQGCNYVIMCHYMGHMNNVQLQWVPLVFLGLFQSARRNSCWGWAVLLGLAMGMQVLSSPYYTVYLVFAALPVFMLAFGVEEFREGTLTARDVVRLTSRLAFAAALAALVSGFYLVKRLASPSDRFSLPLYRPLALDHYLELLDPSDPALFIGLPMFILAVLSLRWWWYNPRPLTTAVALVMIVCLSLMVIPLPGTPYWFYYHLCPMFQKLRVPLRFFPLFNLLLIALNALYLDEIYRDLSATRKRVATMCLWSALVALNWLVSPWVVEVDLATTLKQVLTER